MNGMGRTGASTAASRLAFRSAAEESLVASTVEEILAAQRVHLIYEFNQTMLSLWKKYGVHQVQEHCRAWVEFVDLQIAGLTEGQADGREPEGA